MRLVLTGLLLATSLTPADNWWISDYGFDQLALDGTGVTVAVIDTGVDDSHPDLVGKVVGGVDLSGVGTPDGTTGVGSSSFHGTMVASLIAGQGSDASGVIGVAPGAELLSVSIGLGVENADTDQQIASGVIWAVDHGADIINLSLSRNSQTWPKSWDEAFGYAFEHDVLIVAAAGNRSDHSGRPSAPATIPGVISVGGVTKDLQPSQLTAEGFKISVVAPAQDLFGSYPNETYRSWGGSSAAAPIVSGLLALMKQQDPTATANDLIARLIFSTKDLGDPGIDASFGYGLIDPQAAIAANDLSAENPLGSLANWVLLYRPTSPEDTSELVIPENPEPATNNQAEMSTQAEEIAVVSEQSKSNPGINPLLYWLLVPLAPLLWFALRSGRRVKSRAR